MKLRHVLLATALLAAAACGKKKSGDEGAHTCDDVEAAMRRIDPDRTADIKAGTFAKLCTEQSDKFTQVRIECTVAAKDHDDLKGCADPSKAPLKPAEGATAELAWRDVPKFGAKVNVPGNVTVAQRDHDAHLTNGTFKLNLFKVDQYAQKTASEAKASLQKEPGFVKFTKEEAGATTWHFDYELGGGKTGTSSRIDVGKPLDCGVHNVAPDVMAMASAACATAKTI
ncbi:MAG: hypothetical protein ABI175_27415 [Polyangiales bacterium]